MREREPGFCVELATLSKDLDDMNGYEALEVKRKSVFLLMSNFLTHRGTVWRHFAGWAYLAVQEDRPAKRLIAQLIESSSYPSFCVYAELGLRVPSRTS